MSTPLKRSFMGTVFGVVGLVWFMVHAFEYVMARYQKAADLIPLPPPLGVGSLFQSLPLWASTGLTAAIWLGLLGALLLLLRDKASVLLLALAMIAAAISGVWAVIAILDTSQALTDGPNPQFFVLSQFLVVAGLWLYARTAKRYQTL